eukprot:GHVU01122498.1.p1 GENE.GHVU01122498.1~~GHVU01122498.1.p1  ORF type:complete len:124 (+),score=1.00 GHVU01122498.1:723-1094(+)
MLSLARIYLHRASVSIHLSVGQTFLSRKQSLQLVLVHDILQASREIIDRDAFTKDGRMYTRVYILRMHACIHTYIHACALCTSEWGGGASRFFPFRSSPRAATFILLRLLVWQVLRGGDCDYR